MEANFKATVGFASNKIFLEALDQVSTSLGVKYETIKLGGWINKSYRIFLNGTEEQLKALETCLLHLQERLNN